MRTSNYRPGDDGEPVKRSTPTSNMRFTIEWDGDLWRVEYDGAFVDCFTTLPEACDRIAEAAEGKPVGTVLRQLFIDADSELSAIAYGRSPSSKDELLRLSMAFRKLYEGRRVINQPRRT